MANAFLMFTLKLHHLLPFTEERSLFKTGSGTGDRDRDGHYKVILYITNLIQDGVSKQIPLVL